MSARVVGKKAATVIGPLPLPLGRCSEEQLPALKAYLDENVNKLLLAFRTADQQTQQPANAYRPHQKASGSSLWQKNHKQSLGAAPFCGRKYFVRHCRETFAGIHLEQEQEQEHG